MIRTCRPEKAARFVFPGRRELPKPSVTAMTKSAGSSIEQPHLLPVFARADLAFERGEGVWLIGTDGERYLDFTCGVAVNALGHCHPHLVAALQEQATKLWHMSNLFKSPDGERLAARLCEQSFADFVFFCNSGAEAMECAHQDDAPLPFLQRQAGAHPYRHLRGRVPWPDAGHAGRDRSRQISRRLWRAAGRL